MATPDYIFTEGFDRYGPVGYVPTLADFTGEWNSVGTVVIAAALTGSGYAFTINSGGNSSNAMTKTLPGNYARSVGGVCIQPTMSNISSFPGVTFYDGVTAQFSIRFNSTGTISVVRGSIAAAAFATSVESITPGTPHFLEWDITFHNTLGIIKIWLDGTLTTLNLTGQDTCATANNYFNGFGPSAAGNGGGSAQGIYDHLYLWNYLASGGSETPALSNPVIETQFPAADNTVNFTIGQDVLGEGYRITTTAAAPAANSLVLRKLTPDENGTLNSVSIVPNATSATAKVTPVVYADNGLGTAPAGLLSAGPEVVGLAAGVVTTLPLTTPQAMAAHAAYWVGYITDTSVSMRLFDTTASGYRAANTYTSGVPNPAPAMTGGQGTWLIWGNYVPTTLHYTQLNTGVLLGDLSYNYSSTVNQVENFSFPGLSTTPSIIYSVAVKVVMEKSDAGARTVDIQTTSGAATSTGNQGAGISIATSYTTYSTYHVTDPNTGVGWTSGAVGAAIHGIKIAS